MSEFFIVYSWGIVTGAVLCTFISNITGKMVTKKIQKELDELK